MKQKSFFSEIVMIFMTMNIISSSAFSSISGSITKTYPMVVRTTTRLQVVDSPSLFSEAQEEERKRKQRLEHIKSKIKETARSIRTQKDNNRTKTVPKPLLVDTITDYKSIVVEETEQLVVVFFHALWCKSCRVTKPLFQKVCQEYDHQVKFVHVPLTKTTAYLQQGLGVPSVPFVHIYHPEVGLVEEMKLSKHHFQDFQNKLQTYVQGYCPVVLEDLLGDYDDENGNEGGNDMIGEFQ